VGLFVDVVVDVVVIVDVDAPVAVIVQRDTCNAHVVDGAGSYVSGQPGTSLVAGGPSRASAPPPE